MEVPPAYDFGLTGMGFNRPEPRSRVCCRSLVPLFQSTVHPCRCAPTSATLRLRHSLACAVDAINVRAWELSGNWERGAW